jgi:type IV pilus assembly protein PilC
MVAGLLALLFLTIKIIPTFATIFEGFNLKLPLLTRMLILISKVIRSYFIFGIGGLIILAFLFRRFLKTKKGRKKWESFLLNFKLTGDFFRAIVVERFSSSLATLLESGVPIIYALEITQRSVGNLVVAEIIEKTKESVRQGRNLSQPLEESGFFEPMIIQMISIGEEIGDLPSMLKRINTYYQEYVDRFLVRFTSLFEPVMLLFLGGVIALMVIGMFLPIFQLTQIRG